jgi:hypothetical protein
MHDNMKITIRSYDIEVSTELPNDAGIEDIIQSLRGMLLTAGFHINTINSFIDIEGNITPTS